MMGERNLRDALVRTAQGFGNKTAISFVRQGRVETEISYGGLEEDSNRVAQTFLERGVTKGDRVIFFLDKCPLSVVAHLAAQKIGAIGVPLNPGFKKAEMAYLLGDAQARLVLCGPAQTELVRDIDPHGETLVVDPQKPYEAADFFRSASAERPAADVGPEDPGLIIYTSGTTGQPKGAILTQENLVYDAENIISIWEITESDVLCHALPLFHVHGLCFALHTALIAGSHVLLLDAFSAEVVTAILAQGIAGYTPSVFMAVPSMYAKMMESLGGQRLNLKHMRLWTSGSAPLLAKDFERIKTLFGKEPVEREGMTETGMNFSNPFRGTRRPGSIGIPLPGLQVRVVDPQTLQDVAPGDTGEFWLKGPAITPGYWRKPEETAKTFSDGWFRTGDLGRVDEKGYYYLTDRIKHIIISGGENISPKEVEAVINRYEGVSESCVVGVPDEKWGERVVAAVVPKQGHEIETENLQQHCKRHLHNWKCPKGILSVKELPRNTMGKVLKEEVKKFFEK
jgi:malonyl-CoA/methylmalonyl-CoA synthetase